MFFRHKREAVSPYYPSVPQEKLFDKVPILIDIAYAELPFFRFDLLNATIHYIPLNLVPHPAFYQLVHHIVSGLLPALLD